MRLIKGAAWGLGGLVLLVVLAVAIAAVVIDGGFVKARLEQAMKEKNRTLTIEGEPRLRLFPVAGLTFGRTTLTEPGSQEPFLQWQSADMSVRVMPLLSGAVVVDRLVLEGAHVRVRRFKDGRLSTDDLSGKPATEARRDGTEESRGRDKRGDREGDSPERRARLPRLVIGEINIDRVRVDYSDETTGQELSVNELTVKLARLSEDSASPLTMTTTLSGKRPEVSVKASVNGLVRLDLAHQRFTLSRLDARMNGNVDKARGLDVRLGGDLSADGGKGELLMDGVRLNASGTLDRETLAAEFSAPRVSVTQDKASGSAVTGTLRLTGPDRKLNARLTMAPAEGNAISLTIPQVALDIEAAAQGGVLQANLKTPVKANLEAKTFELANLIADLSLTHPRLPKPVRLPIQASLKGDGRKQTLALNASANAEELDFKLKFDARRFTPLDASFDLSSERMNIDRYPFLAGPAAGAKPKAGDERLDLSGLAGPSVQGKIRIGSLQAKNVKLQDLAAELKLARGTLELAPHTAKLYGGTLSGSLSASARGNQVTIKETLQGVQINPLLKDLADKDILEGKGDVSLDVSGAGATVPLLKRSLAGSARISLKDGAYKGINLAELFRNARAAIGSRGAQQEQRSGAPQKTDFTEMSASFAIKGGIAHNDDLTLKSPFVRAGGVGDIDIGASSMDYVVKPTLVATASGQQGKDSAGLTVPVRLHGPFDAVKYDVDYSALVSNNLKDTLRERLNQRLGGAGRAEDPSPGKGAPAAPADPRDQLRDQVRDRLKGILSR